MASWVGEDITFGDTVGYERYHTVEAWLQEFTSKTTQVIDFALNKLEWPVEYGLEKILPLVTLWDMRDITQSKHGSRSLHLKPHR